MYSVDVDKYIRRLGGKEPGFHIKYKVRTSKFGICVLADDDIPKGKVV